MTTCTRTINKYICTCNVCVHHTHPGAHTDTQKCVQIRHMWRMGWADRKGMERVLTKGVKVTDGK